MLYLCVVCMLLMSFYTITIAGLSPINASLTIEGMASSWSSMDSNRLAVTPSMTGSSPNSERSVRISSPPIRRAHSPYLLSLQGQGHRGSMHRRPLVKQYSMDVGSDPSLNNINTSIPDMWGNLSKESPKPEQRTSPNMSKSQPSLQLKDFRTGSMDSKPGSLDSKEGVVVAGDRLPARERIKHKLLRSRSSGAKYSRFRDKYKQSNLNKMSTQHSSDTSLSKEKPKLSGKMGSIETGSDIDDSQFSDWGSEEAACDEEVKMITGGTEDEEDDIQPTLSPYTSEDRENYVPTNIHNVIDSAGSSTSQSTTRADSNNTPRVRSSHPKCKSPMPPPIKSGRNPGIDNTSFEFGEDMHLPPCCKAREAVAVRRSNSFSPSKHIPKAFSPPMVLSPRSDRSLSPAPFGYREHTPVSPLALPPSPLALEDSAYKVRNPDASIRDCSLSPAPPSMMLTVPSPHSMNPHMRSPSPTPPKQVHLAPPTIDSVVNPRRSPMCSPAPLRRQLTLTHSSAIDHDPGVPTRRSIPHTLSVDSAFLAPPGLPQSYSINDPFTELHGGCRAASSLPSPRNSQQTLPGMFTRSASTSIPTQQPPPPSSQTQASQPSKQSQSHSQSKQQHHKDHQDQQQPQQTDSSLSSSTLSSSQQQHPPSVHIPEVFCDNVIVPPQALNSPPHADVPPLALPHTQQELSSHSELGEKVSDQAMAAEDEEVQESFVKTDDSPQTSSATTENEKL